jgi:hypothetical protein
VSAGPATAIQIADAAAAAAQSVPDVIGLDGGPMGAVATYGDGRRVRGATVTRSDGRTHVALRVRARFGVTLPELAAEVRRRTFAVLSEDRVGGPLAVDIEIVDVVAG